MNMGYYETFINLKDLTKIFKEHFNCSLSFSFVEDRIELEIYSIETCNRWYMFIEYQFNIDDVVNKFKDKVVRDTLKVKV